MLINDDAFLGRRSLLVVPTTATLQNRNKTRSNPRAKMSFRSVMTVLLIYHRRYVSDKFITGDAGNVIESKALLENINFFPVTHNLM